MARIPNSREMVRERKEGQLACLGNALVRLELVDVRMRHILAAVGRGELISPAFEDLQSAEQLIVKAQRSIAGGSE